MWLLSFAVHGPLLCRSKSIFPGQSTLEPRFRLRWLAYPLNFHRYTICASLEPRHDTVSPVPSTPSTQTVSRFQRYTASFINLFPLWAVVASVLALQKPSLFTYLTSPTLMQNSLSLLMLSTGLTLSPKDLFNALRKSKAVLFAFVGCYVLMPSLGLLLARLCSLEGEARAGLLLLAIVSGGQASNLCTQVARGDTALSVAMTMVTTLVATFMLPLLSAHLLGTVVPVDGWTLAQTTARVTLLPIMVGAVLNGLFPTRVRKLGPFLPVMGIIAVLVLVIGPVSQSGAGFMDAWRSLLLPVLALHSLGGVIGFMVPYLMGERWGTCVATGFEIAFKSPVLAFVLAKAVFPGGVELASTVSIVVLAPLASLFAVLLRLFSRNQDDASGSSPLS